MAGYSENTIQDVINSNDIVNIISEYVTLKRAGRNYMGLCPFHREKTPSFVVSPDKQIYHCFGCGEGGNVISFVMKIENIEFIEALEKLAIKAGIELKPINTGYVDNNKDVKEKIFKINQEAANYWYKNLYSTKGKVALDYLYKRKLDDETIKKFGLGYSNNINEMFEYLKSKGFTENEILKSVIVEKKETRYVDKFRNRLMFPIVDTKDRVIAFGGRVMDDSKPKYINSPDTLIYSKSRNLYGLNIVKKQKLEKILIVEGYMDTISVHQRGISIAVASLGTALTEEQARLLKRYSTEVVIGYDADSAGQAATLRGLDILNNAGCIVKVLRLDTNDVKDPDEYIIKYGSGRFNNLINSAITLVEFKLQILLNKYNIDIVDEKIKFLNEMAVVLASINNEIERDVYVKQISEKTGISSEPIYAQINKIQFKFSNDMKNMQKTNYINIKKVTKDDNVIDKLEKYLIFLLLEKNKDIYNKIKEKISVEDITNDKYRGIIQKLYSFYENEYNANIDIVSLFKNDEEIQIVTSTICLEYSIDNINKIINDLYKNIQKNKLENEKSEILNKLKQENIKDKQQELEKQLSQILIKINKL